MATMNISLPDDMKGFIDAEVSRHGYGTGSEYIRTLVRRAQDAARLRELILEGARSPITATTDDAYFDGKRDRVRRAASRAG